LSVLAVTSAFVSQPSSPLVRGKRASLVARPAVLDPIRGPLDSYASLWTPLFEEAQKNGIAPDWLLHWGHPAAMASVLLTMGLYGSFLGLKIRQGEGEAVLPLSLGETARELHPKIMGGAFFFFVLGGQGGLVLNKFFGNEVLASPHANTAFLSLGLLALQALLPVFFKTGNPNLRRPTPPSAPPPWPPSSYTPLSASTSAHPSKIIIVF